MSLRLHKSQQTVGVVVVSASLTGNIIKIGLYELAGGHATSSSFNADKSVTVTSVVLPHLALCGVVCSSIGLCV